MACFHPLNGWFSAVKNPYSGKRKVVFKVGQANVNLPVQIPCGHCIGCRIDHARSWALRCVHEASLYSDNCFITLTYDDEHLPPDGSLVKSDFQKFMKRLRERFSDTKIRFFHCGEYSIVCGYCGLSKEFCSCGRFVEVLKRPHYHACLFNFDFPDKYLWSNRSDVKLYRSEILEDLWPFGFSTIGEVNYESAFYLSKYILKKISGEKASDHYCGLYPEYITMSRRPGLAKEWFDKFKNDVYSIDRVVEMSGLGRIIMAKPPRFYDSKYEISDHDKFVKLKGVRKEFAMSNKENRPARLRTREKCLLAGLKRKKRGFENGTSCV